MTTAAPQALYAKGFHDLISVIPPASTLTPTSKIAPTQVGKIPGRKLPTGLWAGFDWRRHQTSAEDVARWYADGANFGIRAGRWPGVDIDCTDPDISDLIAKIAFEQLGAAPVRIGLAPKRLLMYRTAAPFTRMRLLFTHEGTKHLVEILGEGQQYLVHGIHPKTMRAYEWFTPSGKTLPLDKLAPTHLPLITKQQASDFLDAVVAGLDMLGITGAEREGDGDVKQHDSTEQAGLAAPSMDILREAVRAIPNTDELFPEREDYVRMGYAIRGAGLGNLDDAFDIFAEWAGKHAADGRVSGNPETVLSDWRRMRGPFTLGWAWISERARACGYDTASLEFETVEVAPTDEKVPEAPTYSDQWLAQRVVDRLRGKLRFSPERGNLLMWDGTRFQADNELLGEDAVKKEMLALAVAAARVGATPAEQKAALAEARGIASTARLNATLAMVKSDRAIAVGLSALDSDQWILNTPQGQVDLRTGAISACNPDALCTKRTSVGPASTQPPMRWLQFLTESTGGDDALVAYLKRLCGYALTGSTREQHLTFIYGPGGNGKSVLLDTLSSILGDYAVTAPMDTFTATSGDKHPTDVAMLAGARLVAASETQAHKRWDEAKVKGMTGGEPLTARFMRRDFFTYRPTFKLVFAGNHRPSLENTDDAMRRRIHIVPFTRKPAVVDYDLKAKLRDEAPAILAWMIAGCIEWQQVGLNPPATVLASTEEYFEEEDSVGSWLEARCELDFSAFTATHHLFDSWAAYAKSIGVYVGTMKTLSQTLAGRGFERAKGSGGAIRGFRGITLRPLAVEDFS